MSLPDLLTRLIEELQRLYSLHQRLFGRTPQEQWLPLEGELMSFYVDEALVVTGASLRDLDFPEGSSVTLIEECPSRSCAILGWTPASRSCVAWLWRRSWNRTRGTSFVRPATLAWRLRNVVAP